MGSLETYTCVILMPGLHLFLKPNILFIHFIAYFIFLFYFTSYSYSLFTLIPLLFLFIFYSFYSNNLKQFKDKRIINDDKREETGQIQYQHHVGHIPYRMLHVMVA